MGRRMIYYFKRFDYYCQSSNEEIIYYKEFQPLIWYRYINYYRSSKTYNVWDMFNLDQWL
jgi:hypothetical protein